MNTFFRIYLLIAAAALIFLGFLAGYAGGFMRVLSGTVVDDAVLAARALYFKSTAYDEALSSTRWSQNPGGRHGVVRHDAEQSLPGFTLYTSGHDTSALLVDMDGNEVHRWSLPFREAWPTVEHLDFVAEQEFMFWRKAVAYPNGDLLAVYDGEGVTPSGHGLVKLDKDSKLLWKYSASTHHDVQVGEDGRIYTLTNSFQRDGIEGLREMEPPILNDRVVILDADGTELRSIDLLQAFIGTGFANLLQAAKQNPLGDYFHTNSVQPISTEIAEAFFFVEPGHILVSMRELESIALIDPESAKVVWAMRGPWIGQHDAEMLPNGRVLIYDNKGNIGGWFGKSRILEFDPLNHAVSWKYQGSRDAPFSSPIRGAQQRLANGNTLITDSSNGRLFEVNTASDVVWEFFNPVAGGKNDELIPVVSWGQRYSSDSLNFLN